MTINSHLAVASILFAAQGPAGKIDHPELGRLTTVTVKTIYLQGAFPLAGIVAGMGMRVDAVLSIEEWLRGRNYAQLREICEHFPRELALIAPGHPIVKMRLLRLNVNGENRGRTFQYLTARFEGVSKPDRHANYKLVAIHPSTRYKWRSGAPLAIVSPG